MGMSLAAGMLLSCLGGAMAADKSATPATPPPAKSAPANKSTKAKKSTAMYECKHCNVQSDKAGKCPKCGMEMTKMTSSKDAPKAKGKAKSGEKKGT